MLGLLIVVVQDMHNCCNVQHISRSSVESVHPWSGEAVSLSKVLIKPSCSVCSVRG